MKQLLFFAAIIFSIPASAQVTKVSLKASGLTCSMCSNSINKALKTLDFIEKIDADVKTYTFEISLKANSSVDFDLIRKKVEGAGFAVSSFVAYMQFRNTKINNNQPVILGDKTIQFVNSTEQLLDGIAAVKIINKGFLSAKEYRKNSLPVSSPGIYYAVIN